MAASHTEIADSRRQPERGACRRVACVAPGQPIGRGPGVAQAVGVAGGGRAGRCGGGAAGGTGSCAGWRRCRKLCRYTGDRGERSARFGLGWMEIVGAREGWGTTLEWDGPMGDGWPRCRMEGPRARQRGRLLAGRRQEDRGGRADAMDEDGFVSRNGVAYGMRRGTCRGGRPDLDGGRSIRGSDWIHRRWLSRRTVTGSELYSTHV